MMTKCLVLLLFQIAVLFSPLSSGNEYTVDGAYEYSIPYDYSIGDYYGISAPKCGKEIKQLDVLKVKKPNQIRISYTGDPTEMALTWTTNSVNHFNVVNYGIMEADLNYTSTSISHQFKWHWDEEEAKWVYISGFIHECLMVNLMPGRIHFYQILSNGESSEILKFVAAPEPGSRAPLSILHTGDVGTFGTSVMITKNMMNRQEKKQYHGILHCGDVSYANKFNKTRPKWAAQHVWDTWGQMAEPIASKMAYMVSPGNHEVDVYDSTLENGTIYSKRFIMPGNEHYYSFGVGMVHFVSVSTDEDIDPSSTQGVWLDRTLAKINKQRNLWPWLVVFQHRPIYNSNTNHGNWSGSNNYTQEGYEMPAYKGWPDDYEALLLKHKVDLVLSGHVHHYERSWPVKNREEVTKSYENVTLPIHITCGHGGKGLYAVVWDSDGRNTYRPHQPAFSAARDNMNWGHCELDFIDERTVRHTMFRMGESEVPTEDVLITKAAGGGGAAKVSSSLGLLMGFLIFWSRFDLI